jgi:hypothetical protein
METPKKALNSSAQMAQFWAMQFTAGLPKQFSR